jgi:hypothetical protein
MWLFRNLCDDSTEVPTVGSLLVETRGSLATASVFSADTLDKRSGFHGNCGRAINVTHLITTVIIEKWPTSPKTSILKRSGIGPTV